MSGWTTRQRAGAAVVAVLAAAAVVAAVLDAPSVALAAVALLAAIGFAASLQLRRRIAELQQRQRALSADTTALTDLVVRGDRRAERVLAELADDRAAALDRHRELLRELADARKAEAAAVKRLSHHLVRHQRDQTREVEALLQLFQELTPRAPMPSSGHWALNPTELLQLWSVVSEARPKLVLELGSGTSSVWLGYAVERVGGRLVSVEHDAAYAEQSRAQLARHGLTGTAEVRVAPLREVQLSGETYTWYAPEAFADLSDIDLVSVDGPPGATGPQARYPAVPMLAERLSPDAVVLLDDADRDDEQEIIRRWCDLPPGLVQAPATLGHIAVLRRR
ncbi:class I SAM-dependent methyltransferase [Natronosporangium hydrolyticum]|uniref:Class I SAM-dependent methyltransferase n=1 Tax=Natronosporangium hydrolyticum TaxID=2811111 RepID=A0A895Y934_9ACTN|nr:class I SAM-dependent methyltransferase [Natronosporangium hydrolyticum]QSB14247.1 class I SAM-dependent methyltransferase [Natronosporangium hydrolyticum]